LTIQVAEKLIKKRTGKIVVHDPSKIVSAIYRAMQSLGKGDEKQAAQIASGIEEKLFNLYFSKNGIPEVEDVQDLVEEALMKWGLFDVAKSFIVYRHERSRIRNQENVILDVKKTIEQYLGLGEGTGKNWRVKENANTDFDYPGLNVYISGTHLARYALYSLYPPEIAEAHVAGHLHIHDLSNSIVGYCSGWSLQLLLQKGFGGVHGRVTSSPPKHLDSAINQMITFLGTLQNEFAGAQAFSSVDTLLSPFIRDKFCQSVKKILRQTFSLKANGQVYSLLDMLYAYKKGEKSADEVRDLLEKLYPNVIFSIELMQTFLRSFFEEYEDNVSFVQQNIQNLIYAVNQTSRWGGQSPFVNLSFDWTVPDDLEEQLAIMSGKPHPEILYRDCQTEIDIFNKVFIEEMLGGDKHNRIFTFPIPTYSITKNFDWDHPNVDLLMKITAKYGIPYFQNFHSSGLEPSSIRAMCCRLNLNILELKNRPGGMWNIGDSTGSIGVVTINLNRLGYLAINKDDFFRLLRKYMDLAQMSLEIKRKEVTRNFEKGMMAYAKEYLPHGFKTYFSTIGLCGMHECCLNFLNKGINTPDGLEFAREVLQFMSDVCEEYKSETGNLYNLEASPAESTSYRFARLDRKWYPNVILSGSDEAPYLTNSSHLPVDATNDLIEAIEHQNVLQPLYTGGTIFHTFIGEEIEPEVCKSMVRLLAEQTRLPYFSITPTFSICTEHKYIKGKHFECPHCGKPTEIYSRIVGYFRPISKWNNGKTQEFEDRTTFEVNQSSFSNVRDIIQEDLPIKESNDSFSEMTVEEPLSTPVSSNHTNGKYISLFISPSCPKCSPFKEQISKIVDSIKIKTINTATEEGYRLAEVFNVQELPTAVIISDEQEIGRFTTMKGMNNLLPDLKRLFGNNESN